MESLWLGLNQMLLLRLGDGRRHGYDDKQFRERPWSRFKNKQRRADGNKQLSPVLTSSVLLTRSPTATSSRDITSLPPSFTLISLVWK